MSVVEDSVQKQIYYNRVVKNIIKLSSSLLIAKLRALVIHGLYSYTRVK